MDFGVDTSGISVKLDPRVEVPKAGEVVVFLPPKRTGGAKFWEANHGKAIILGHVFSDHV